MTAKKYIMDPVDREHIEHKYHDPAQPHNAYKRFEYHGYEHDPSTGMSDEELRAGLDALVKAQSGKTRAVIMALAEKYLLDNTRIDVNEHDWYVGFYSWGRLVTKHTRSVWASELFERVIPEADAEKKLFHDSGIWDTWPDYDHSIPDWDSILSLGFYGLRRRAAAYRAEREKKAALTEREKAYFESADIVLSAVLDFIHRLRVLAEKKNGVKTAKIAVCLKTLETGAPTDTLEALQTMYLYFMLSESVEGYQVRSLGSGFDRVISPFYERDLASGKYTEAELDDFIAYLFMQFYAIGNYWGQPLFLGGRAPDGGNYYSRLSLRVLRLWDDLDIHNPKIQVLFNTDTPKEIRYCVYDMIRRGKYLTVVCEPGAAAAVKSACGCSDEEAKRFIVSGCYEPLARGGCNVIAAYPNLPKILGLALRDGFDPIMKRQIGPHTGTDHSSFDELFAAFEAQFSDLFRRCVALTNTYERYSADVSPAILYSSTRTDSLALAEDGYACANPHSNSVLVVNGFATLTDSLAAIKKVVFEEHAVTLPELVRILDADWEGYDGLRLYVTKECPKYGTGDHKTDMIGRRIVEAMKRITDGAKNVRGGSYVIELHSAMEFVREGAKTEATPDGRRRGEETSKNASPSVGADRRGATALIRSCTDAVQPENTGCGFNLDVMLHPSALTGDDGLAAMDALVAVYMKRMGVNIQFNVVSADTLRLARKDPEKYKNLQIRVCGWNVLWNDIPREQQEAYIRRAEAVSGGM